MRRARQAAWVVALHVLEAIAIVAAGIAIVAGLVFWRLTQGPISLDVMRGEVQSALAEALNGDVVSISEVQASWRRADRSVGIVLTDVSVAEAGGELIARAPRIAVDLSLGALLRGDVAFSRLVAEGGEASVVRTETGALAAGLGGPDRIAARAASRPPAEMQGFAGLRQALDALEAPGSMARDLRELRLEGATLYVRDALTGVDWRADDATLRITRDAEGVRAEAGGSIATPLRQTELRLSARAGQSMRRAIVEVSLRNAVPSELFPAEGKLGALARVELPITAAASAALDDARGLLGADLDMVVESGRLRLFEREIAVERARAQMSYDPVGDALTVNDAEIASDLLSTRLSGRIERAGDLLAGDRTGGFDARIAVSELWADVRPIFEEPLEVAALGFDGAIYPSELRAAFDTLTAQLRGLSGDFAGEARLERVSDGRLLPSIKIAGAVEGEASVDDVVDFWPVDLAEGARSWLVQSVHDGRAFDVTLDLDFPAEAVVAQMMDDERLTLSFGFAEGAVTFVTGMSQLTDARGTAVLRGNSFTLDMEDGRMAGLDFESGFVDIPRLNPKGADARFGGVVTGEVSTLLTWLDEPPLEFPSGYGIDPMSIGGAGRADFAITRAMLADVPPEDIGYEVSGRFEGVSAPTMFAGLRVTDATVDLTANPSGLTARGNGRLGPAPALIEWREDFTAGDDALSTSFHVETTVDAAAFDTYGAPVRQFFTGSAGIVLDAQGRGLEVARADVVADLTSSDLAFAAGDWSKPAGVPGAAQLTLGQGEDGGLVISDAVLSAPGADIEGGLALAADGRLLRLILDRIMIEDLVDARGVVTRGSDGGLIIDAAGAYADVRSIVAQLGRGGGGELGAPLRLDIQLDRATARDGVDLTDLTLALDHDGSRTRRLSFEAQGEVGAIEVLIEPAVTPGGPRLFSLDAADAGEALYTVFGVNSVRGGTLTARADLPALDAPADAPTRAMIEARDFVLASAPALAQILTIGSLESLANTLNGEGIQFNQLQAPLTIVDGTIAIDEARASGPGIGVTVSGDIDLDGELFDVEGVLVPVYGVNSALGAIPVIGDIFVSRQGEGVFGLTYSIQGPFDQASVFVNPLSIFGIGFTRRLFEPIPETPPVAPRAPATPEPAGQP